MKIRFAFALFLLFTNLIPLGFEGAFSYDKNESSAASCFSLQAESSDSNSLGDCSRTCKDGFPCSDCGTACCAQFLAASSHQLSYPTLQKIRFFSNFDALPAPDLGGLKEPPRA